MATPTQRIQALIKYLPSRDIPYAEKFIKIRDFESLLDLVTSSIKIVENNLKKETPKEEYLNVDLVKVEELLAETREYCLLLGIDDFYGCDDQESEIEDTYE